MDLLDLLKKEVNEAKQALADSLVSGAAQDYATYREFVGRAAALDLVLLSISDIRKAHTFDED